MMSRNEYPTLVFLHYFGGSAKSWQPVVDLLTMAGWECLTPDLRGFGDSAPTLGNDFSVDAMADDIEQLVKILNLPRYVFVGHSMGGKVALALAARNPPGLLGLTLLAPSPPTPEPISDTDRSRLLAGFGDAQAVKDTLAKVTAHHLPKALFEMALADSLRSSRLAWRAWLEQGSREDISDRLARINVPVSIAVGAEDQTMTSQLMQNEILNRLPDRNPPPVSLPESGHLLPLEQPAATARFITQSLSNI